MQPWNALANIIGKTPPQKTRIVSKVRLAGKMADIHTLCAVCGVHSEPKAIGADGNDQVQSQSAEICS
jgi:hypothetical protein